MWLPSIETQTTLALPRRAYIWMCGNIAKHDPLRLARVAGRLQQALATSGVTIDLDKALLALGDFYARFHTDVFSYHGSTVVELLTKIRWGIHDYLLPQFRQSYTRDGCEPPMYRYIYPPGVTREFARNRYWDLMNYVRAQPILPRFEVAEAFRAQGVRGEYEFSGA